MGKNFGTNNNWESDFYFSGFTVKVRVNFGKGETKEVNIIPALHKKINLVKGVLEDK